MTLKPNSIVNLITLGSWGLSLSFTLIIIIIIIIIIIVWPCDIQIHSGLGLQPNNMAHSVPKPRPQAAFRPIERMIFINSYYATSSGSHLVIYFPNKKVIAQPYYLSVARQCRGASLSSMSTKVGTISKATLTTPHSHLNIHLQLTILDLPLH